MGERARVCARAAALLREVVDVAEPDQLPPYNEEAVRLIIEECHEHYALMRDILRDLEAKAGRRARRAGAQPASAPEPGAAATAVADAEAADGDAGPSDDENADPNAADDPAAPGPGGDAAFADAPDAATSVVVHHEAILRNKRLVLTYLTERLDRLKALRWRHPALPDRVRDGLSASEREFCAAYDRLVSDYCSSSRGIGLDLAAAGAPPRGPGDAFVLVARPGLGDVAFSTGTFTLALGTTHALPRDEAGPLIREGALVEVAEGAAEAQHLPTCLA